MKETGDMAGALTTATATVDSPTLRLVLSHHQSPIRNRIEVVMPYTETAVVPARRTPDQSQARTSHDKRVSAAQDQKAANLYPYQQLLAGMHWWQWHGRAETVASSSRGGGIIRWEGTPQVARSSGSRERRR